MFDNQVFASLVKENQPTGEVVGMKHLLVYVRGLQGVSVNSVILFENGSQGLVRAIEDQVVVVLSLDIDPVPVGTLAVLQSIVYQAPVGEALIGRVVNVLGQPLDGKGPVATTAQSAVFSEAPAIIERQLLSDQLVTGVTIVDALFPVVLGQRIAVLGDNKSGKSAFLTQLTQYQAAHTDHIMVYVLIAKRQVDVDRLVGSLNESGAIKNCIVVVASSFDSLAQSYLAPYVACAMAEHLWHSGRDVIVVYDDLSNHAKVYREMSLLAEVSPGRDSYPGDMFYSHSSLLERAGKMASNGKTLTALPVVLTPNDDVTAYLPTNIMSITDGQIIFDLLSFRKGIRPAVNVGLSVSRVGGRVQSAEWKDLSGKLFRKLADYRQAAEFAQFGSELALQSQADLALGKLIYEVFKQTPQELFDLNTQFLMLAVVMESEGRATLNVTMLKQLARQAGEGVKQETEIPAAVQKLLAATAIQAQRPAAAASIADEGEKA